MTDEQDIKPETDAEAPETEAAEPAATPRDSAGEPASQNFGFYHREGQPTGEHLALNDEQIAARKKRNLAIAWSLVAFMVLVFGITVLRLSQNIANGAG